MEELESQAKHIKDIDPDKEPVLVEKRTLVEERFRKVLAPLQARRNALDKVKRTQQFLRDVEDEKMWIQERMPQAKSTDYGNSLLSVQMLIKKNQSLRNEIESHEPRINGVRETGQSMIDDGHPQSEEFQRHIDELSQMWDELNDAARERRERLRESEVAQQVGGLTCML